MIKINKLLNFSERNYNEYLAIKILEDISNWKTIDVIKRSYLNRLDLIDFPNILCFFYILVNKSIQEDLVRLILLSRSSKEIDLACSNAATILVKSDFIFRNFDFSKIRIPKADLSQKLFVNLNFEGSYLEEVNFAQSQFQNVNFKNCDLSSANFGYFKSINSTKGKGLSFSSDDKYFWYKNDDSIIEMDLENHKIKNEWSLIDFITINISRIYSLRFKLSSTTVHKQYIKLWDSFKKSLIYEINLYRVVISPNLKFMAALDANSTVLCWDLEKKIQKYVIAKGFIYRGGKLIFSPSNRHLVIIRTKSISIIKTEAWTLCREIRGNFRVKNSFAISYCGQKIAFNDFNSIYLIDTITSAKIKILTNSKKILCMSFSPCGKFLALAIRGNKGFIIDIKSQSIFQTFTEFKGYPKSVIFSNSVKYISWSDSQEIIKIYKFTTKFRHNDSNSHLQVSSAKVSPKGSYLITSTSEKSILWDFSNFYPKYIRQLKDLYDPIFSPHETYLVRESWNKLEIYDIKRYFWFKTINLEKSWFRGCCISYCENYLIALNKGTYEYFRFPDFLIVKKIYTNYYQNLQHIGFSNCGNYDFLHYENTIYIWDLMNCNCLKKISFDKKDTLHAIAASLSKIALFFISEKENYINILDTESGKVITILVEEKISKMCFAISNERLLAGGYQNGNITIWDLNKNSVKQQFRSLFSRYIDSIEVINGYIIVREWDSVEIFNMD